MIEEAYCSYEVSKLLKEKGFDGGSYYYFYPDKFRLSATRPLSFTDEDSRITNPTHQMAMAWLREIHKLSIEPFYYPVLGYCVEIKHIGKETEVKEFEEIRDKSYNSYEEAVEAALNYVLKNLI